ncbi:tRNA (adenosine(37)-N6)-threonylcarbamoyltransferase complex ATPase subunit type 1 TsaE [Bounagaea algeriensis]
MKPLWQALAWAGGVAGAAGVVLGVAGSRRRDGDPADPRAPRPEEVGPAETRSDGAGPVGTRSADSCREDPAAEELPGRSDASRSSTVSTDDGVPLWTWEFDPVGDPDVTAVFVHGFALDSRAWTFQLRTLAASDDPRVRVVAYDQRGHGRSGYTGATGSTIEQLAADLDAVLRAVVPRGPIALVGHSMGGMVVMELAERCPDLFRERVRAVAFIGTAAGGLEQTRMVRPWLSRYNPVPRGLTMLADVQPDLVEWVRHRGDAVARRITRSLAFGGREVTAAVVDLAAEMIGATRVEVITDFLPTFAAHERTAALAALESCEVLVLGGDADRITPFSCAEAIAEAVPHARLASAEEAGHLVMLEKPELVNEELFRLLRSALLPGGSGAANGSVRPEKVTRTMESEANAAVPALELSTEDETWEFGRDLGARLRAGDLVLLDGPLGAGKTVLTRGIAAGMGVRGPITSPTFVIARVHDPESGAGPSLVHVDAYRLSSLDEVDDLDLDTDLTEAAVVVEWGEGMAERLADSHLLVRIQRRPDDVREVGLHPQGPAWRGRELGSHRG